MKEVNEIIEQRDFIDFQSAVTEGLRIEDAGFCAELSPIEDETSNQEYERRACWRISIFRRKPGQ